jgi:hypothetical protein
MQEISVKINKRSGPRDHNYWMELKFVYDEENMTRKDAEEAIEDSMVSVYWKRWEEELRNAKFKVVVPEAK